MPMNPASASGRTTLQDNSTQSFGQDLLDFFGGVGRGAVGQVVSAPGEVAKLGWDAGQSLVPAARRVSYEDMSGGHPLFGLPTYAQVNAGAPQTPASAFGQLLGMAAPALPDVPAPLVAEMSALQKGTEATLFPWLANPGSRIVGGSGAVHPPSGMATMRKEVLDRFLANEPELSSAEAQLTYGSWRGPDNMARFEIDDSGARLLQPYHALTPGARLPDVLHHPELYWQYPQLKNTAVEPYAAGSGNLGSFNRDTNTIRLGPQGDASALSTLLHEAQHNVQNVEGFVNGGSPTQFAHMSPGGAYEAYLRIAGEAEARQVQARANMDALTRASTPFYAGLDVPYKDLTLDSVYRMPLDPPGVGGIEVGGPGAQAIEPESRMFHNSPHAFPEEPGHPTGRFNLAKVNTGEGTQDEGYGIYFNQNPGVSEFYLRQFLTRPGQSSRSLGMPSYGYTIDNFPDALATPGAGMLHRELKMGEQSLGPGTHIVQDDLSKYLQQLSRQAGMEGKGYGERTADPRNFFNNPHMTGKDFHDNLWKFLRDFGAESGRTPTNGEAKRQAAMLLKERDVPGTLYMDSGSWRGGNPIADPTHNAVVWDQGVLDQLSPVMQPYWPANLHAPWQPVAKGSWEHINTEVAAKPSPHEELFVPDQLAMLQANDMEHMPLGDKINFLIDNAPEGGWGDGQASTALGLHEWSDSGDAGLNIDDLAIPTGGYSVGAVTKPFSSTNITGDIWPGTSYNNFMAQLSAQDHSLLHDLYGPDVLHSMVVNGINPVKANALEKWNKFVAGQK